MIVYSTPSSSSASSSTASSPQADFPFASSAGYFSTHTSFSHFATDESQQTMHSHSHLSPRELYLRALEQERDEILAAAYAQRNQQSHHSIEYVEDAIRADPYQSAHNHHFVDPASQQFSSHSSAAGYQHDNRAGHYGGTGSAAPPSSPTNVDFRQSVRDRQQRLEFIRRQEHARRLAMRALQSPEDAQYVIKRLPPPHPCPATRLAAAIKIQRAYRAHLFIRSTLEQIAFLSALLDRATVAFYARRAAPASGKSTKGHTVATVRAYSDTLSLLKLALHSILHPQSHHHHNNQHQSSSSPSSPTSSRPQSPSRPGSPTASVFSSLASLSSSSNLISIPSVRVAADDLTRKISAETEVLEAAKVDIWVRELRMALRTALRRPSAGSRMSSKRELGVLLESDDEEEEEEKEKISDESSGTITSSSSTLEDSDEVLLQTPIYSSSSLFTSDSETESSDSSSTCTTDSDSEESSTDTTTATRASRPRTTQPPPLRRKPRVVLSPSPSSRARPLSPPQVIAVA